MSNADSSLDRVELLAPPRRPVQRAHSSGFAARNSNNRFRKGN